MTSPTPNTALVVGATGIAGRALSHLLVDAGWEVLGLARRGASDVRGVVPVQADLTDIAGLLTGLKHYPGPFEAYGEGNVPDTPFHEDEDRLPYPNFDHAQEEELQRDELGPDARRAGRRLP